MRTKEAPKRPLRRDAEENRRRLLEAARELFAAAGFEVTMDEIAARAGVGVGTAYRRFASKEELLGALFEERVNELYAVVERALLIEDPWEAIAAFLRESVELQACDRGLKELLLSSPRSREFVTEARARIKPGVDELVQRAAAAGELRPGTEATDLVMVQIMLGAVTDLVDESTPDLLHRFLPLLLEGLRGGAPLPARALTVDEFDLAMERGHRR
ncbi:MAG: helix-turn-helix domain-containing protein [Solirubrobacterales bacterium]